MTPRYRTQALTPGFIQRCPCCLAKWATCPCTSVMCPKGGKQCIDHCRCWDCRDLRSGAVATNLIERAKGASV